MAGGTPSDAIFVLADISGYTRFMLANRTALAHGQGIITDLLEAVIREVEIPLEVHKFEGDAVFIVAEPHDIGAWEETGRRIGMKLHAFVDAFDAALRALAESNTCRCGACENIDKLTLKVLAHRGTALRYRIAGREELSGVDVILVHRLLKNSVPGSKYILLSEAAFGFLAPGDGFHRGVERYDDVGEVPVRFKSLAPLDGLPKQPSKKVRLSDTARKMRYGLEYLFKRTRGK
jgi:hypothetical protein